MPLEFITKSTPRPRERWVTGIYELDRAFHERPNDDGNLGIPINTAWEFIGQEQIGKSTIAHSLAMMLGNHQGKGYVWSETEGGGFDVSHLEKIADALGYAYPIGISGEELHPKMLSESFSMLTEKDSPFNTLLWDSVAATVPMAEENKDFGEESDRGRKAKLINDVCRRAMKFTTSAATDPKTFILVNHKKEKANSRNPMYPEYYAPGGVDKNYLTRVKLDFTKSPKKYKSGDNVLGMIVKVKVQKNSFGGNVKGTFPLWIRTGHGLSPGMTNLNSAINFGVMENSRGVLKHKGESLGKIVDWYNNPEDFDFSVVDKALEEYENG